MMNIMHPTLRRLDLNLLPVFDAIYRHRSVRKAADELAMSTSALSHALSRLRVTLNDPLFYREGHRMCPSVYATELAPSVASALKFLDEQLTPPPEFDPLSSTECLKIAITDFTAFCIFPALMHRLQCQAPGLRFELRYLPHSPALNELLAGEMDLALGFSAPEDIRHPELEEISWLEDDYVVISNARRTGLTLEEYLAARHLVVTPWNEERGVLDVQLEQMGCTRQIAIKTPSMLSAPFIVAESDLLMALPRFAAQKLIPALAIRLFELPFHIPSFEVKIYSHQRSGKRGATDWLKTVLHTLATEQVLKR
ncbi:LysR family transcriptional regulator [Cronobacter dublinensis]|uniref:LysR family transcriptional regulator n=1 Tax=Cronobacter dublinensis TaxID=413497 RepID=UPI0003A8C48A|nr:LysR family transcriptional regulator [Cronobacter dublinensis]ELQ5994690.1 LysR family transcriptional regulator [Cronobacter dublinensis]ELY2735329.1 LysR family transcriptional regulator [Cronobacter dublinensis]MDI6424968.1 LysR family transcriptional regulator [Cronobacter dublinensis]MDI7491871.1 LysR family transcriptional regulator [Cronobacter dublinensis]MDT3665663.1 LysR family transcriptional regulator [Cronobacter dublinensis]